VTQSLAWSKRKSEISSQSLVGSQAQAFILNNPQMPRPQNVKKESVRKHAQQGGFPANQISEVRSVIDPTTAKA